MKKKGILIIGIIGLSIILTLLIYTGINTSPVEATVLSVKRTSVPDIFIVRTEIPSGAFQSVMSAEEIKELGGTIPDNGYWQKYKGTSLYGGEDKILTNEVSLIEKLATAPIISVAVLLVATIGVAIRSQR